MFDWLVDLFWWSGFLSLVYFIGRAILITIRNSTKIEQYNWGWAVVTGATDGIGKQYAEVLAEKGFNVILVSRNENKLKATADELKRTYRTKIEYIQADFSESATNPTEYYENLMAKFANYDISVLINNVGILAGPNYFSQLSAEDLLKENIVNLFPQICLMRLFFTYFTEKFQQTQQQGLIFNLSSCSADTRSIGFAHYGATKLLLDRLSVGVSYIAEDAVRVVSIRPFYVDSNMTMQTKTAGQRIMGAVDTRKFAYSSLGYLNERSINGHPLHNVVVSFFKIFPEKLTNLVEKLLLVKAISGKEHED